MRCLPEKIHKLSSVSIKNLKTFIDLEDFSRQIFYDFYAGWYIYVIVIIVSLSRHSFKFLIIYFI